MKKFMRLLSFNPYTFLSLLILLTSFQNINENNTSLDRMGLHGRVRQFSEKIYLITQYDESGIVSKERVTTANYSKSRVNEYLGFDRYEDPTKVLMVPPNFDDTLYFNKSGYLVEKISDFPLKAKQIYKYDNTGNVVEKYHVLPDGTIYLHEESKYDSFGNLIEWNLLGQDFETRPLGVSPLKRDGNQISNEYEYKNNKIIRIETSKYIEEYKYNNENKKSEIVHYSKKTTPSNSEYRITMKYYPNGNLANRYRYNHLGDITSSYTYLYYENNKLSEITQKYRENGNRDFNTHLTEYKYDSSGNRIEINLYRTYSSESRLSLYDRYKYIYDRKGRKIEAISFKYDSETNLYDDVDIRCHYTYDYNDNWTKKIIMEGNVPKCIINRSIQYY